MKMYFVEVGVLCYPTSELFEQYNEVYDHQYGYYDENQFWEKDFKKAKTYVEEYVKNGVDTTYGLIKEYDLTYIPIDDGLALDYDTHNIIFSIMKDHNEIIPNFIKREDV